MYDNATKVRTVVFAGQSRLGVRDGNATKLWASALGQGAPLVCGHLILLAALHGAAQFLHLRGGRKYGK